MLIEHEWHAYNARRYSKPWAAKITWNGVKPVYDFIGRFASGVLAFEAEPGEIVAMGQKDHRGNGSSKDFYLVGPDGVGWLKGGEAEARRLWLDRAAEVAHAAAEIVTTATTPDNGLSEVERLLVINAKLVAALEKIVAIKGSTGGPASMVAEFKFIAEQALDMAARERAR